MEWEPHFTAPFILKWTQCNAAAIRTHLPHALQNGTQLRSFLSFHRTQKFVLLEWDPISPCCSLVKWTHCNAAAIGTHITPYEMGPS